MSFDPLLACDADEAHVLFDDEIDHGDLLGYRIPVPTGVPVPLEVRITLAYASPIEPSQPTEYTPSRSTWPFAHTSTAMPSTRPKGPPG